MSKVRLKIGVESPVSDGFHAVEADWWVVVGQKTEEVFHLLFLMYYMYFVFIFVYKYFWVFRKKYWHFILFQVLNLTTMYV